MTRTSRVLLGASIGAVLTLLLHPASRPYLLNPFFGPKASSVRRIEQEDGRPKAPTTVQEGAQWAEVAAEKMATLHSLSKKELVSLRGVVLEGRRRDPTNAFWTQMDAVVEHALGNDKAARQSWIAGSRLSAWDDYQSDFLNAESKALAQMSSAQESWHFAYLYHRRLLAAARLVEKYARRVVAQAASDTRDSLDIRYATVANGALMRDGSRNVEVGEIGAFIVEIGAYPSDLATRRTPKRLLLAENDFFNRLIQVGETDRASFVQNQFGRNEAWQALSEQELTGEQARNLGMLALVLSGLPGAILAVAMVGLGVWWIGVLCEKAFPGAGFGWAFPVLSALVLGAIVYLLTSFVAAAFAASLCGLFLAATPTKQRSMRPKDFGPTFGFTVGVLATATGTSLAAYLVWGTGAADALVPYLNLPGEYFGSSTLFIGLAVLFFAMLFLATPFWALAQRIPTPYVFGQGLKLFGLTLAVSGLLLTVLATPIVIYADQRMGLTLRAMLLNEPVYYHLKYGPAS